ncbi:MULTISPECIES: VanZ family protein [unclassified Enterococcus]|uniref:VanZ family protein n=1 Tax=unclassified Enterococcus TaxID=2608891 RepID=UPI001555C567|nr:MULTISPECIES: VanZ family protein [unclassified Enterococcus]MBS7578219.1 VanZ family protein [Enterococcus sp. MMGLQ5-2]MBS7585405.1 VanZ family protein [Enterococcus sp. MMGLQ5-1]NPD13262.1 VanZ family protein [Enterococcus sp. MMGLQ5-1]NPD38050.1 VanZ family protein [Enterococcus sp. MMGLQ5-2]
MSKKMSALISLFLAAVCFISLIKMYNHVGFIYLSSVLWMNQLEIFDNHTFVYSMITVLTVLVFTNLYYTLQGKMKRFVLYAEFCLYMAALLVFLLLKSPGVQGINLSFTGFWIDLQYSTFEVIMNIVLFIPLGILLANKLKLVSTILLSLLFILSIESIQYIFKLGVFDVIDIATNFSGILIGYLPTRLWLFYRSRK